MSDLCPTTTTRTEAMLRTALGPVIGKALADPDVVEIMANPDGSLWVERHGSGRAKTETGFTAEETERVVRLVASHVGREAKATTPIVSAELPGGGERFEGVLPPVAERAAFSIRKPAARVIGLADYVEAGLLPQATADALADAVRARRTILVVGGTGSGKTTLANALLEVVADQDERIVILEDTRELRCEATDKLCLRTRPPEVTLADLVRSTLRLRPDRIVVGEVRGAEALDMLKAWNTGHPGGIATIHANSALGGLHRLEQLVGEAATNVPRHLISEAIDVIIFIAGRGPRRRIEEVAETLDFDGGEYRLRPLASSAARVSPLRVVPLHGQQPKGETP